MNEPFDATFCATNFAATTEPLYKWTADQMAQCLETQQKMFAESRRRELRGFSEAIEKIGPCSICGHKITYRHERGDAIVLCERMYLALCASAETVEATGPCDVFGRIRLEPFPCEPRAPLQ
jgi:hypothetical protein